MPKRVTDSLPEVFLSTDQMSSAVSRAVRQGKLRKLGSKLYTTNTTESPERIVRRNAWQIAGLLFPGAVIGDRIARIMMNAELVATSHRRIIIPTVYRNNYLSALRALAHNQFSEPIICTLDFAQKYTASIQFDTFESARSELTRTHAFVDPGVADAEGVRLRLP